MTHRTHAVAKTRAHQVRWSSRCRSRAAGAGAAAGARGAAAAGRGRTTQLRLSSASTLVDGSSQLQRSSHALLRPQESKCNAYTIAARDTIRHRDRSLSFRRATKSGDETGGAASRSCSRRRSRWMLGGKSGTRDAFQISPGISLFLSLSCDARESGFRRSFRRIRSVSGLPRFSFVKTPETNLRSIRPFEQFGRARFETATSRNYLFSVAFEKKCKFLRVRKRGACRAVISPVTFV